MTMGTERLWRSTPANSVAEFDRKWHLSCFSTTMSDSVLRGSANKGWEGWLLGILVVINILFACGPVRAATNYVRQGAAGASNGRSWTDAWPSLPTTLVRGDVYYIADGQYPAYTFDDPMSGTTLITVKKATLFDHGASTGWQSSYGDGQAIFRDTIRFNTSNYIFDGQVGGGPGAWTDSDGYGFRVDHAGTANGQKLCRIERGVSNITVKHTDFVYSANAERIDTTATDQDTFYSLGCTNVTVSYCSMRYPGRVHFLLQNCSKITVEYTYHYFCKTCASQHSESWSDAGSDDIIIRHNLFKDNRGTGIIVVLSRGSFAASDNWEIYGNVFVGGRRTPYDVTDGAIPVINGQEANRWKIYNNAFINLVSTGTECGIDFSQGITTAGGHEIYNNLWYGNEAVRYQFAPGDTTSRHDFSYFINNASHTADANQQIGTSDPFVDYRNLDFNLRSPTQPGRNLPAPYNSDGTGALRGLDGVADRGAYEFRSGAATNATIQVSPGSLAFDPTRVNTTAEADILVHNAGGSTLSGNASTEPPFQIVAGATYSLNSNESQVVKVRYSPVETGNHNGLIRFTGGGDANISVSGSATNPTPIVSAIAHNATDVDPSRAGVQVFSGSVVRYWGSASDTSGLPINWHWVYRVNDGPEVVFAQGSGTVSEVEFAYNSTTLGTYSWILRANNGLETSQSVLNQEIVAPPPASDDLTFVAAAGTISPPFIVADGALSQALTTTAVSEGGLAVYTFAVTNAGRYVIQASVNASTLARNSFFINIDAMPEDPYMVWDIVPLTVGFEQRFVSWRGNGAPESNELVPKYFDLAEGTHELYLVGREANTQIETISLNRLVAPPRNFRVLAGP